MEKPNGITIVTRGLFGAYLGIPNNKENSGKRERTSDQPLGKYVPVEGLQFMGGGIEDGETPEEAAIREAREEGGLNVNVRRLTQAPYGLHVEQELRGLFAVQVFYLRLSLLEELRLRFFRGARTITLAEARNRDAAILNLDKESRSV